jgi:hypothetical protein
MKKRKSAELVVANTKLVFKISKRKQAALTILLFKIKKKKNELQN